MTQQNERQSVHRLPDIVHHLPQPFQHCLHGVLTVGDVVQITLGYLKQSGAQPSGFLLKLFLGHQMMSSFLLFNNNTEKKDFCDMKNKKLEVHAEIVQHDLDILCVPKTLFTCCCHLHPL